MIASIPTADRIVRVWQHEHYGPKEDFVGTTTPVSMVGVLKEHYPEIEDGSRVHRFNALVKRNAIEFNEAVRAVDPSFFNIFDFELIQGNTTTPFSNANAIVLSETAAIKYFGEEDPIGQTLSLEFNEQVRFFEVTAVVEDPPKASSIQFEMLVSLANETHFFSERAIRSWFNVVVESYLLLKPGQSSEQLEKKLPAVVEQYLGNNYEEGTFFLHLQPLTEIHLDNSLPAGLEPVSSPTYPYIMGTIGIFVLLLACINFITLSIGRSFTRATEVGVRKALGAFKTQIVYQFWSEALLITLFAVGFGIALSYLFQDTFNAMTGIPLSLTLDLGFWALIVGLILFIALIAGIYPSIVLSRFNPTEVLRRKKAKGKSMGMFGKSLVIVQFVASIVLLVGTLVISGQMDFLVGKDLGYQKEAIVVVPTNMSGEEANTFADLFVSKLKKQPQVAEASASIYSFGENGWFTVGFTDKTEVYREFMVNVVDPGFLKTHQIQVAQGRDFQDGNTSDAQNGVLVNEAFVREFGLENTVGYPYDKLDVNILGVMQDFNFQSLDVAISPLMLTINPNPIFRMAENVSTEYTTQPRVSVRLRSENITNDIAVLKSIWNEINPTQDFEYSFLDESLAAQYQNEQRSKTIVNIASLLSIFIACMGLFGLATLTVARRTAEIGIRKVLGATALDILRMVSKEFVVLILIAILLAFPLAWWAMDEWLKGFAYKMDIDWTMYVLAGLTVMVATIITVSAQSLKVSMDSPVKSLRTE